MTISLCLLALCSTRADAVQLTIHLRGVASGNISVLPVQDGRAMPFVASRQNVRNGETAVLQIDNDLLPMECIVRFDYQLNKDDHPYPAEQHIVLGRQDVELWINPAYHSNPDSIWFQAGEQENTAYRKFIAANGKEKNKLLALQQFLAGYDVVGSPLFHQAFTEYERRRIVYNKWLSAHVKANRQCFSSSKMRFEAMPFIDFSSNEVDRMNSMLDHYFDEIDFRDSMITRTTEIGEWMTNYVNQLGRLFTSDALRDSLLPAAAVRAIEKAKKGDPLVYGWMVDYFYTGFEANNMPGAMKALEPYINDPDCLTKKRVAVQKRLEGIGYLKIGSAAPDFLMKEASGKEEQFLAYKGTSKYKLLLFWSADCNHCLEELKDLYPYCLGLKEKKLADVIAVSVDNTDTEIAKWERKKTELDGWLHLRAEGGVNSKEAGAYYILSTPTMILVDAATNRIVGFPGGTEELRKAVAMNN